MRAPAAALAACLLAAGCGGSSEERADSTATPSATPRASPTAFAPSAPEPPENGPEAQPGGAGDEEPILQRVRLTVGDDRGLTPREVRVDAFLAVDLAFRNRSSRTQLISVTAAGARRGVQAGPGRTVTMHLEGLRPGRYRVEVARGGRATLIAR
jgi:hypothetical protein